MFEQLKSHFFSFLLKIILNSLFLSCKWNIVDESNLFSNIKAPKLICCWHSRGLFVARYFKYKKITCWGISSTHADSEILARILNSWKIKLIRGSSTRGWVGVIKQMIALFKNSSTIIAVASDGPRGPRKTPKMGSVDIAFKHGAQIIAAAAISSRYWTLPTWDQTKIPKPFSTIYIKFSNSLENDRAPTKESISRHINNNQTELTKYVSNKNN